MVYVRHPTWDIIIAAHLPPIYLLACLCVQSGTISTSTLCPVKIMSEMSGSFQSVCACLIVNTRLQARLCPPLQHHRQAAQEEGAEQEPLPVQQPQPPLQVGRVGLLKGFLRLCVTEAVRRQSWGKVNGRTDG